MSERLKQHLLYRLHHHARRLAVETALERNLLAAAGAADASDEDMGGRKHRGRRKVEEGNSFAFRHSNDDDDDAGDILPQRLKLGARLYGKTRREATSILKRLNMASPPMGTEPEALVTLPEVLSAVHASALPYADEVAVSLLLAQAVEQSGLTDEACRGLLRRCNWQVVIRSPVDGFDLRLVRMLKEGSFASVMEVYNGQDLSPDLTVLPSRYQRGRTLLLFRGIEDSKYAGTAGQEKVAFAARLALPVLGLAGEGEHLPLRLCRAADLQLETGSLTSVIVRDVLHEVLGEAPADLPQHLPDELTACLSIHDLAAAVRPGLAPREVVAALMRLAGKDDGAPGKGGRTTKAESSKSDDPRSAKWRGSASDAKDRGRAISSGSEVVEPAALTEPSEASVAAAEPGLSAPPTVETLHGYGKAANWALDLKLDLALWRSGQLPWSQMSTRLLLSGPPGTGKTTFARALCNTLQVPLIATSVSTWLEPSHLGDVIKRMRLAFEEAQSHAPAILFVDEIDGIGRRGQKNEYDDYWNSVVNKLLELMDGTMKSEGLIIVGATNHPDVIDPAIRRSGRLETHIEIPLPDVDALVGILAHHLGGDCATVIETQPHREPKQEEATVKTPGPPPPKTNSSQMEQATADLRS